MSRWVSRWLAVPVLLALAGAGAAYEGVGRAATPAEIRAWDIDVRPDLAGLPPGAGSVEKGEEIWDGRCTSCHGTFGESNEVFTPLVGGTGPGDIESGRVAALARAGVPHRTAMMKLATLSTLWDYVNRAMPWDAPKSLSTEDVYAVVGYMLHLAEIVPYDFVLSDRNFAEVESQLPNRHGMTREHGLWDVAGIPDVVNVACMTDCQTEVTVTSALPDSARDSHGNLAEQNRLVGPVRGVGEPAALTAAAMPATTGPSPSMHDAAARGGCLVCHDADESRVGPSFSAIAARYGADPAAEGTLRDNVKNGGRGNWGPVPMPPQAHLNDTDITALVRWILAGAQ